MTSFVGDGRLAPSESPGEEAAEGDCADVLVDLSSRIADQPLTYRIPPSLRSATCVGVRALVPLGSRTAHGFVLDVRTSRDAGAARTREILDILDPTPLFSPAGLALARTVASESLSPLLDAVRCLVPPEVARRPSASRPLAAVLDRADRIPRRLGRRQREILAALTASPDGVPLADLVPAGGQGPLRRLVAAGMVRVISAARAPARVAGRRESGKVPAVGDTPTLLWGDSEARRRWIVQAASAAVRSGRQVIVAVPQIAEVPDLVTRLTEGGSRVAALHSGLPASHRRAIWTAIHSGDADVVVGTRSALFSPLDRLGLIVVEDEHDPSYKADAAPRYHARAVALARGRIEGADVVLGTQTPSVEAYAAVADGQMRRVTLSPTEPHARVTVVDMRRERHEGRGGILAPHLLEAIRRHLRSGGRIALFVNRVGYARVLLCRECGYVMRCPRCEIPMPYDRAAGWVQCRICAHTVAAPDVCPRCKGVGLWWIGAGTARVEEVVRRLFPTLRTARVDRDTARDFSSVAEEFAAGRLRLLVGTQLLLRARRLRPSLIGVIDADAALYLPDFRAAERAYQQLRAVVSLASGAPAPEAVLQTRVPDHPVIDALRTGSDERLYDAELRTRSDFGYPPYTRLIRLIGSSPDRASAWSLVERAAAIARARGVEVLGPAPALSAGTGPRFRVQCILRSSDAQAVHAAAREALEGARVSEGRPRRQVKGSRLIADVDPQEMH